MPVTEATKKKARTGTHPIRVLIIEHSKPDVELCMRELERAGYAVEADVADDLVICTEKIRSNSYDVILADYNLESFTGLDAFFELGRCGKETPFILVTGTIGEEAAVDCIKLGVTDYVLKDRLARLPIAVRRALEAKSLEEKQHRTAKQLWASEAQLGLVFAQLPATVWTTDRDLRVRSLNGMGLPRLGWREDQVIGCTLQEIYTTQNREHPAILAHRRALLAQSASYHHMHGDRQFSVRVEPLRDQTGNVTGCLSLALDVTETTRTEAELKESKDAFEALIEASPVPIVAMDRTGTILHWNPAAERAFGWRREEILGEHYPLTPPEKQHEFESLLSVILQGGTFTGIEVRRQRKDGSAVDVSLSAAPLRNAAGEVTGVMSIIADITERKRTEAERHRLSTAVEQSAETVMITDRTGQIQYVNPAFTATTGYSREDVIGKHPNLLKSGQQDKEIYERLWKTILAGETWRGEITNRRKDGSHYVAEASITPVRDEIGKITEFIAIQNDITEKRALERKLVQAQRHDAIGQLAGGIAHDFNNVLGAILGMAELGLMEAPEGSKIRDRLEKIQHHGGRAVALTRQLTAFARRQELERHDINLNHAVAEIISLLGETLGKDIDLRTKLASDLSATCADPGQVEQILLNLCLNARDAMPKGGQLFIETSNTNIDAEYCRVHATARPGPYVCLIVSDTGAGMDVKTAERIFEPFFTTKPPGKGTGLGLATVYGIVKQHDGFINVYSEPGAGATFRIYFPSTASAGAEAAVMPPLVALQGGDETILVADDHEGLRDLISESLQALGYRILLAENGEEALRQFNEHPSEVDLVVLDVVMPGLGGPDAFAGMTALRPDLPAIFCTGYNSETPLLSAAVKKGALILQKPYTTRILAQQVRTALDGVRRVPRATHSRP